MGMPGRLCPAKPKPWRDWVYISFHAAPHCFSGGPNRSTQGQLRSFHIPRYTSLYFILFSRRELEYTASRRDYGTDSLVL